MKISQEDVRSHFKYNKETGDLKWRKITSNAASKNKISCVGSSGYIIVGFKGRRYLAHRLIWLYAHGVMPDGEIDHINRNRQDNRISNLRDATSSENNLNRDILSNNTSGTIGVSWHKASCKWGAKLARNGVVKWLGLFESKDLAIQAREKAVIDFNSGEIPMPRP